MRCSVDEQRQLLDELDRINNQIFHMERFLKVSAAPHLTARRNFLNARLEALDNKKKDS